MERRSEPESDPGQDRLATGREAWEASRHARAAEIDEPPEPPGNPDTGALQDGDPRDDNPRDGDPRDGDPRDDDPRDDDPRDDDPGDHDPRDHDSWDHDPGNTGTQDSDFEDSGIQGSAFEDSGGRATPWYVNDEDYGDPSTYGDADASNGLDRYLNAEYGGSADPDGGDEQSQDGAEPPLPTEPGGTGLPAPDPTTGEPFPLDQTVWADEPMRSPRVVTARRPARTSSQARAARRAATEAERARTAARATTTRSPARVRAGGRPGVRPGARRTAGTTARGRWWRRVRADVLTTAVYLVGGVYVLQRLLPDPVNRIQANVPDQTFFEWMLAYGTQVVTKLRNPFFTDRLNAPVGVNLMANTSVLGISVPLTPVTLLFGAAVTYAVFSVLALAGTAASWYYVLSRHVVRSRLAAAIAGGLAGFAPAMISHSYGHPNIVAQFLVPFIVWRTIRLRERGQALRNGIVLGLLVTWQAFINEEVLLIAALGLLVFLLSYAAMTPSAVRRDGLAFLRGLSVAVVLSAALLAYPLYIEFFGPEHGTGVNTAGSRPYPADLLSFVRFSGNSLAGSRHVVGTLAQNVSEQSAFFGWPLLILLGVTTLLFCRSRVYLSVCVVAVVLAALSLGSRVTIGGRQTNVPGPWAPLADLPLFRQVVPTRVAVAVAPVLAVLLALAYDRVAARSARDPLGPANLVWHGLLIAALVPLVPVPLPTTGLPPIPPFVTQGSWHRYVDENHSLVGVPAAAIGRLEPQRWAAATDAGFAIAGGYYLAPSGAFGAPERPTSRLLDGAAWSGTIPAIGPLERAEALSDLRFWRAAVVVVVPGFHTDAVIRAGTELLGFRPTQVGGVWVWDVRQLPDE